MATDAKRRRVDDGEAGSATPTEPPTRAASTSSGISIAEQRRALRAQAEARQTVSGRNAASAAAAEAAGEGEASRPRPAFGTLIERYYTQLFKVDVGGVAGHDQYANMHSNRLFVVGVAPHHPLIARGSPVVKVNFDPKGNGQDLAEQVVSGKRKKGGKPLSEDTVLCAVECADGERYLIRSCVKGKLLEVNTELVKRPELLTEKPDTDGFIAIMSVKVQNVLEAQGAMLPLAEYRKLRTGGAATPVAGEEASATAAAGAKGGAGSAVEVSEAS